MYPRFTVKNKKFKKKNKIKFEIENNWTHSKVKLEITWWIELIIMRRMYEKENVIT